MTNMSHSSSANVSGHDSINSSGVRDEGGASPTMSTGINPKDHGEGEHRQQKQLAQTSLKMVDPPSLKSSKGLPQKTPRGKFPVQSLPSSSSHTENNFHQESKHEGDETSSRPQTEASPVKAQRNRDEPNGVTDSSSTVPMTKKLRGKSPKRLTKSMESISREAAPPSDCTQIDGAAAKANKTQSKTSKTGKRGKSPKLLTLSLESAARTGTLSEIPGNVAIPASANVKETVATTDNDNITYVRTKPTSAKRGKKSKKNKAPAIRSIGKNMVIDDYATMAPPPVPPTAEDLTRAVNTVSSGAFGVGKRAGKKRRRLVEGNELDNLDRTNIVAVGDGARIDGLDGLDGSGTAATKGKRRSRGKSRKSSGSLKAGKLPPPNKSKKRKKQKSTFNHDAAVNSDANALDEGTEYQTPSVRRIDALPIKPPKTAEIITDYNPKRKCTNPLLSLPYFPPGPDPPLEEIPQGGELWALTDIHFAEPDTFPLSYTARVLGLDVGSESGVGVGFAEKMLDVETDLKKMEEESDVFETVQDGGPFAERVWKRAERDSVSARGSGANLENLELCNFHDPMWLHLLATFRGLNDVDFNDAPGKGSPVVLSPYCIKFAQERGLLRENHGMTFHVGGLDDAQSLQNLVSEHPNFCNTNFNLATSFKNQSSFCIVAKDPGGMPIGFITYRFCWYKFQQKKGGQVHMTSYGVKSRSGESNLATVSEVVVIIDSLVCCDVSDKKESTESGGVNSYESLSVAQNDESIVTAALNLQFTESNTKLSASHEYDDLKVDSNDPSSMMETNHSPATKKGVDPSIADRNYVEKIPETPVSLHELGKETAKIDPNEQSNQAVGKEETGNDAENEKVSKREEVLGHASTSSDAHTLRELRGVDHEDSTAAVKSTDKLDVETIHDRDDTNKVVDEKEVTPKNSLPNDEYGGKAMEVKSIDSSTHAKTKRVAQSETRGESFTDTIERTNERPGHTTSEITSTTGRTRKTNRSLKDTELAKVMLTSLALDHAARSGTWYGMLESHPSLVSFFAKYFRMNQSVYSHEHSDRSVIPLLCDLKKCSYRFAILLLEESFNPPKQATSIKSIQPEAKERIIVNFFDATKLSRNPSNDVQFFTNPTLDSRAETVHIRLLRHPGKTVELKTISGSRNPNTDLIDPSSIDTSATWNVLRSFPLSDILSTRNINGEGSNSNEIYYDDFLAELTKKQDQLRELETSIEKSARRLMSEAYNERIKYEKGEKIIGKQQETKILHSYHAELQRQREAAIAWQAQLEQDMDAVCDVCFDGEVTPDNQIIFCDSCNVAVHQKCYGIDRVPSGNYFCHPCTYFEKDREYLAAERRDGPRTAPSPLPIVCELCPKRQGAFVQVDMKVPTRKSHWVHTVCAKWHGMNYVDIELKDRVEDLTLLKDFFKTLNVKCYLCKSGIGALHKCRQDNCDKYLHLTCARSVGTCSVQHGEGLEGIFDITALEHQPWTLACPDHSDVDPESIPDNSISTDQLVSIAKSYPPEPLPPKPFHKMSGKERKVYWSDDDNLAQFFDKVLTNTTGAKCAICDARVDQNDKPCNECGVLVHTSCAYAFESQYSSGTCSACRYTKANIGAEYYEEPKCHLCNQHGGFLVKSSAKPVSMKVWKKGSRRWEKSLFGGTKYCHAICAMWNEQSYIEHFDDEPVAQCKEVIMSNGMSHITHQFRCVLCGLSNGVKADCSHPECRKSKEPWKYHISCARAAGFEVNDDMKTCCFRHVDSSSVFRARLEDFLEVELCRFSDQTIKASAPISWDHASELFHAAVTVLRTLGWAWRWSEWWVKWGDNWEPLIENHQNEADMTDEELKKVPSTPESRCADARRCRLAAFGAALRNRDYDKEPGDDKAPLERALRAILSTPSLVGPLKSKEIDFYVTWLSLAYRSKSSQLFFGDDKIPVANDSFCLHTADGSPKFELGKRPLPGKNRPDKGVFEPTVDEVDDFLLNPLPSLRVHSEGKKKWNNLTSPMPESEPNTPNQPLDGSSIKSKNANEEDETSEEEFLE